MLDVAKCSARHPDPLVDSHVGLLVPFPINKMTARLQPVLPWPALPTPKDVAWNRFLHATYWEQVFSLGTPPKATLGNSTRAPCTEQTRAQI